MGKDDASSASLLGGGKENIAADGCVSIITVELKNPDAAGYSDKLKELYGEPTEINDIPSEGSATWESWIIQEIQIRLYQQYELSTLEITGVSDTNGRTDDNENIFIGWEGLSGVYAGKYTDYCDIASEAAYRGLVHLEDLIVV